MAAQTVSVSSQYGCKTERSRPPSCVFQGEASRAVSVSEDGVAHVRQRLEEERWSVCDDGAVAEMTLVSPTHFQSCFCGLFFFFF